MKQLIERIRPSATYSRRQGWMSNADVTQIRGLLKKQAELLLEKCGYDTDAVDVNNLCDVDAVLDREATHPQRHEQGGVEGSWWEGAESLVRRVDGESDEGDAADDCGGGAGRHRGGRGGRGVRGVW